MNQWQYKLDTNLPGDLRQIAEWIHRAEEVLAGGLNFDPSTLMPEENFRRFNQLNEDHIVRIAILCCLGFFVFLLSETSFVLRLCSQIKKLF